MDDRAPKPPLTDDPRFLEDLADLDEGLIDPTAAAASHPAKRLAPFPGQPARRSLTPEASAALAAASEALAAFDATADSSVSSTPAFGRPTSAVVNPKARQASLPEAETSASPPSWRSRVLLALLMIGLMLAGAATAAWMFRAPLQRAMARWHVVR